MNRLGRRASLPAASSPRARRATTSLRRRARARRVLGVPHRHQRGAGAALVAILGLAASRSRHGPVGDLIVRASTPPGATGRFTASSTRGLDVGSLATPVFYGWLMDHSLPQGVFYTVSH